jgi:hypothetical protein
MCIFCAPAGCLDMVLHFMSFWYTKVVGCHLEVLCQWLCHLCGEVWHRTRAYGFIFQSPHTHALLGLALVQRADNFKECTVHKYLSSVLGFLQPSSIVFPLLPNTAVIHSPSKASATAASAAIVVATAGGRGPNQPGGTAAPKFTITRPPGFNLERMLLHVST